MRKYEKEEVTEEEIVAIEEEELKQEEVSSVSKIMNKTKGIKTGGTEHGTTTKYRG